jgi:predicted RNA binding protein YcfA (HicA-like mRNA interferase family)
MSKHSKLLARLTSKPKDFHWTELISLMAAFGYELRTTGGSGRKFTQPRGGNSFVTHEPHPGSILKSYQVREFIAFLKQEGHIP